MSRPSISTATGDRGDTGLFGGKRLPKSSPRIHAYGTVDELNAILGVILSEPELPKDLKMQLQELQRDLFVLGADLAAPLSRGSVSAVRIEKKDIERIERWGTTLEANLPALQRFILPSGSRGAAMVHLARTVCRRAERWMVETASEEDIGENALIFVNRLSDYFFLLARSMNTRAGKTEVEWVPSPRISEKY